MEPQPASKPICFGEFELDVAAGELRRNSRRVKLQPQPFKLLVLLAKRAGTLVARDEIRRELWSEGTFVDFDQAVNFSIRQIRDVLRDVADRPLYIETVPRRGYRFIAPIETDARSERPQVPRVEGTTAVRFQKALWTNIAELRMADERRGRNVRRAAIAMALVACAILILLAFK